MLAKIGRFILLLLKVKLALILSAGVIYLTATHWWFPRQQQNATAPPTTTSPQVPDKTVVEPGEIRTEPPAAQQPAAPAQPPVGEATDLSEKKTRIPSTAHLEPGDKEKKVTKPRCTAVFRIDSQTGEEGFYSPCRDK